MIKDKKPLVLCLVGPTASGKSSLALRAAQQLSGEIVCLDSMQVYRGMDIGTAKPSPTEQALVPHHLFDSVDPKEAYSVAQYQGDATNAILDILSRGKLPVLCGGTGLYLRALSQELGFGGIEADPQLRAEYEAYADKEGRQALHALLQQKDPKTALRLHPNDLRRVIRALEVIHLTGRPFSAQQPKPGPFHLLPFAIDWPRETLYQRVEERAEQMLAAGLLSEVEGLLRSGVSKDAQSMQGLGYKEMVPVVQGDMAQKEALCLLKQRTRNYAKRQLTWFRADSRVVWLPASQTADDMLNRIQQDIKEHTR